MESVKVKVFLDKLKKFKKDSSLKKSRKEKIKNKLFAQVNFEVEKNIKNERDYRKNYGTKHLIKESSEHELLQPSPILKTEIGKK